MKLISKISLLLFSLFTLVACSSEGDISDFEMMDANTLNSVVDGTYQAESSINTQTMLLIALVVIAFLILIAILIKNKKK
jgi:hypothetical protein